jgi:tetratricopeptide (TPR) repeat protein
MQAGDSQPPSGLQRIKEAAAALPEASRDEFRRLVRVLLHGPAFQWILIESPSDRLRDQVLATLDSLLDESRISHTRIALADPIDDVPALEAALVEGAQRHVVVHVLVRRRWFDAARWDQFNVRRERVALKARARLVFWLDAEQIEAASRAAPDLWAWRSGVYRFAGAEPVEKVPTVALSLWPEAIDLRDAAERRKRIEEIQCWLHDQDGSSDLDSGDAALVAPVNELGQLLWSLGEYGQALAHLESVELPLHRRRDDGLAVTITRGKIADILQVHGQLDEALRIREHDELPVYERLGDVRSAAVTRGKIADILQARGQLDEALRIREHDELPVYERLGDVRSAAVTRGQIADILHARGQLDEALRIREHEQLPVFERLGDVRSAAVTHGKIADILQARGQLDEALRIREHDELPVLERLGDARSAAASHFKVAQARLRRGDYQSEAGLMAVLRHLKQAYETSMVMGTPDGIAAVGLVYAHILAIRGAVDMALDVLKQVTKAQRTLGDSAGEATTVRLRAQIEAMPMPAGDELA